MSRPKTPKTELVIKYLKKYGDKPIMTVAKKMYADHPEYFTSLENARTSLRYHSGLMGDMSRKSVDPELAREKTYNYSPFEQIPSSHKSDPDFIEIPIQHNNALVLNDIHFPYHDEGYIRAAIKYGLDQKVNCIYLNGDILDMYSLSRYDKRPSKAKMNEELEMGRWFLKELRLAFPNAGIYYKIGNHEERLENWLHLKAPEWINTEEFELKMLLRFGENRVKLVESMEIAKFGDLYVAHGHEFKGAGGVYPARSVYEKVRHNIAFGHFHRATEFSAVVLGGKVHRAYSLACGCELHPDYMPYNNWTHGFGHVRFKADGSFSLKSIPVVDGDIVE